MFYILTILIALITTIFYWIKTKLSYWQRVQVETANFKQFFRKDRPHVAFIMANVYQKMKEENKFYIGMYHLITPILVVKDLDLIKNILVNDFETFPDRGLYFNPHNDPLSINLVRLTGNKWRSIRQKLTPTFTSAKIKTMFPKVREIGDQFVGVMRESMEIDESIVEVKDLCARFTTDVIGSVAFGLECSSLREPQTEFRSMGNKAFYNMHPLMDALSATYPKLFNILGYKAFPTELIKFYVDIVRKNVEYREEHHIKCNDFLDVLIQLKNNKESFDDCHFKMEDVVAQAFAFFVAGFESSSSTMAFALYELAHNTKIQETARQNIRDTLEKHHGHFSYESLNDMLYIKQVVQETLRKHPVVPSIRRVCRSPYTLPGSQTVTIDRGVQMIIPIYGIHHDPDYYPEPEQFQPETISNPFGAGPRVCVAERFGLMQTMIGVALLLKNFKFSVCEKTPKNLNFDPMNIRVFSVKDGIYLKVESVDH